MQKLVDFCLCSGEDACIRVISFCQPSQCLMSFRMGIQGPQTFFQWIAILFNLNSRPKGDFKAMKAWNGELSAVLCCTFSARICLVPTIPQRSPLLLRSSHFFQIFTISQAKVFFLSWVPSVQLTPVLAALGGICGAVHTSWIWNICQEYSSGAVVHNLTNQHWISSMYLHSKQLI